MIFRSTTIVSTLLLLGWSSASSQPLSASTAISSPRCNQPVGRVIGSGDSRLPAGSLLCKEDRLQPVGSAKVEILCYLNRKVLLLGRGNISGQCSSPVEVEQNLQCNRHNRARCPRRKGPTEDNRVPTLIAPYSSIVLDPRPDLVWTKIPGITSYKVRVTGVGVDWSQTVASNQLQYPQTQPPLKFGNAYKITVIANQGDSPVTASLATINVLNAERAEYIKQLVGRVSSLNLSSDERAYLDLDSIYMSYGLLTQSIEVLKARIEAGSTLPEIYTTLGDRYLEAGLPNFAKPLYQNAIHLAQKIDNSTQIEKAKAGLRKIEFYSQLPTRMKVDQ